MPGHLAMLRGEVPVKGQALIGWILAFADKAADQTRARANTNTVGMVRIRTGSFFATYHRLAEGWRRADVDSPFSFDSAFLLSQLDGVTPHVCDQFIIQHRDPHNRGRAAKLLRAILGHAHRKRRNLRANGAILGRFPSPCAQPFPGDGSTLISTKRSHVLTRRRLKWTTAFAPRSTTSSIAG
jgi:hypothetical protein